MCCFCYVILFFVKVYYQYIIRKCYYNLSIDRNIKRLEYYDGFCSVYYVNVFWINIQLAKKSNWCQFVIFYKMFFFLSFLNLGTLIRCPKKCCTDLKSALDKSLSVHSTPRYFHISLTRKWFNNFVKPSHHKIWYHLISYLKAGFHINFPKLPMYNFLGITLNKHQQNQLQVVHSCIYQKKT